MAAAPATLANQALDALRSGDARRARQLFDAAASRGEEVPWLALARACNMLGDPAAEEAALRRQLDANKRDLPALLAMGELKMRGNDVRVAALFFQSAIAQAALTPALPPQLRPMIDRARACVADAGRRYASHLTEQIEALDIGQSPRLAEAIDLLMGRSALFVQQPSMFYFPGLAQRAFFEREEFDWVPALEAAVPAMKAELEAVLADGDEFDPYVTGSPTGPPPNNKLLRDRSWGAYYFWRNGARIADHAARCPVTMAALEQAPMPAITARSPLALWSILKPGTHIEPHFGMLNTRLICHVPLLAPEGCALRVGAHTREWQEGRTLIFDDSFEHEAWNRGTQLRVVLLFEIWRPDIGPQERAGLTRLFEAIDLFDEGI